MSALVIPFAVLCSLALASVGVSFLALFRSRALAADGQQRAAGQEECRSVIGELQRRLDSAAEEIRELQERPEVTGSGLPKMGFNLNQRSQALRLHRRGDSVEQIATALEVPRQEIDLLIKVHRIAMSGV